MPRWPIVLFRPPPKAASDGWGKRAADAVSDLWCSLECTPACQAGGRGFKSRQVRHQVAQLRSASLATHGRVAQLVEHAPEKRGVTGSTPVPTTTYLQTGGLQVALGHSMSA
jgi:hypothetical protein